MVTLFLRLGFKGQKIGISSSWQDLALKAFISKQGCAAFRTSRQYLTVSPHPEEDNYPIAYSIVVHRGSGQEMTQIWLPNDEFVHIWCSFWSQYKVGAFDKVNISATKLVLHSC